MTETDDIVASLRAWAPLVASGYTVPAAGQVMENAATALTDRDAQIERLTRERKDFAQTISEWATKAGEAEGRLKASEWPGVVEGWKDRATTAERDLAEARAEVERLKKEAEEARVDARRFKRQMRLLVDHCSMDAFDKLEEENGAIVGWSKTDFFSDILSNARAALAKGGVDGDA